MNFSITVMSHPERENLLQALLDRVNSLPMPCSFLGVDFVVDRENNVWHNLRNALLSRFENETHKIVLEDDVFLPEDFLLIADKAIQMIPNNPIAFFTRDDDMLRVIRENFSFIASDSMKCLVAFAIPVGLIEPLIKFNEENFSDEFKLTDTRVSAFTKKNKIMNFHVVPSVVEHIGDVSLVGNIDERKATVFRDVCVDGVLLNDKIFYKESSDDVFKYLKNG